LLILANKNPQRLYELALENFKYLSFDEMENFKTVDNHIEEIKNLLATFDTNFDNIVRNIKRTNIKGLQNDLRNFRNSWKDKYNKEMINNKSKNKNKDKFEFSHNGFLDSVLSGTNLADIPKNVFQKSKFFLNKINCSQNPKKT
jgi:hypothetical protein